MKIDHDVTLRKIKAAYTDDKKKEDMAQWWSYHCVRGMSFYPTWLFLKLRISANSATWFSTTVSLVGAMFLAFGEYWTALIGALLINSWLILDYIDGNIARYHKQPSVYGAFLDSVGGYTMLCTMLFATGIGVFRASGSAVFIILGAGASLASIFPRLVYQKMLSYFEKRILYKSLLGSSGPEKEGLFSLVFKVGNNLANPSGFLLAMLLLFAVVNRLQYFLYLYFCLYLGIALLNTRKFLVNVKANRPG
ncbi:CDP-alcohol phosphatidyltransferase family protein [bacterium]|nr:CDP-alcohol phosphatidyltransferase family protein [bacterium]